MKTKLIALTIILTLTGSAPLFAQQADTIIMEEIEMTVTSRRKASYVSGKNVAKVEVTTAAGLAKMACCSLAESFENSAAVTVGYSDAVTGTRQIKMLGLSGIYTQMLDESRPVMRGLIAPYGLSYTPGAWLNSIQTSKGISSVIAGHEAITGQINVEPRKPTTTERLFVNAYIDNDLRGELNVTSALPINDKLSTIILAHGSINNTKIDHNGDGFMDAPLARQINLSNRWLYMASNGMQIRAGAQFVRESRKGGSMKYDFARDYKADFAGSVISDDNAKPLGWGTKIENTMFNGYVKLAVPTDEKGSNIAFVADYTYYKTDYSNHRVFMNGDKGIYREYLHPGDQKSILGNLFYHWKVAENHSLTLGASATVDNVSQSLTGRANDKIAGGFAEYTLNVADRLTLIGGIRADYANFHGWFYTPRAHLKWNITDYLTLRGSAGMGYRGSQVVSDNIWALATDSEVVLAPDLDRMEQALTYGGSLTYDFKLGYDRNAYVSFDVFHTSMIKQIYADQESAPNIIDFYNTRGATTTYQMDFSWSPVERFDIMATFRYNDSHLYNKNREWIEKPMMDNFKGILNLQYATKFRKWVFDVTGQINGRSRLPQVMNVVPEIMNYSPVYPMFYAQITRKFKKIEVYVGCENIANYTQKNPILETINNSSGNSTPWYDASVVWGPIMGRKFYAGMRFTLDAY